MNNFRVSTPSRLCLFGEHLDYLSLEVIAVAINLRFSAEVRKRDDSLIKIRIRDSKIDTLGEKNDEGLYDEYEIDLSKPIECENNRDYLKSSVNVLLKNGYKLSGLDIKMDSEIPIGKGMCSSSTMIIVLIKALLQSIDSPDADDPKKIAYLGFYAEVAEFNEPGGMMDHYTSALGGLVNLGFYTDDTTVRTFEAKLPGKFILFDSLDQKDTTRVLANAKTPALEAIKELEPFGITCVQDFLDEKNMQYTAKLDEEHRRVLEADIDNYKILLEAKKMFEENNIDNKKIGELISRHHANLRDGLKISTDKIELILETAKKNGAYGGKINGSGGGGCCYVYADDKDCGKIIESVNALGFPAQIMQQDSGVRFDGEI